MSDNLTREALQQELWNMLPDSCKKIMDCLKETYIESLMADIDSYCQGQKSAPVWVKASDLPEKEHNYHVKATAHFQGYNHNDTALWRNNKWEFDSDNGRIVVEWLDESGCEAKKALEGTLKELIALINEKAKYGIPVDLAVGTKAGAMCIEIEELTRKALEG